MKRTNHKWFVILLTLLLLGYIARLLVSALVYKEGIFSHHAFWSPMSYGSGFMMMGGFWILVIIAAYYLLTRQNETQISAVSHLNDRLARGEISLTEYEELKKQIRRSDDEKK